MTAAVEEDVPAALRARMVRVEAGHDPGGGGCLSRTPEPRAAAARRPETIATYLRLRGLEPSARSFRKRRRRYEDDENAPFTPGRDPRGVGDVLADLTREAGWDTQLAREDVVRAWAEVAGEDTARHTRPVAFSEGTLTVQADSTAWAKQLQLMRVAHPLRDRPAVPRRGGQMHPLHRAGRPLLEMGSQNDSRAWSARYLRLRHVRYSSGRISARQRGAERS